MILSPGTKAPDFILKKKPDQTLSLAELRGQPVVLVFYPADWSPVCGDELALFNEVLPEFQRYGAQVVGISVDGVWCHKGYAKARNLEFPLLADEDKANPASLILSAAMLLEWMAARHGNDALAAAARNIDAAVDATLKNPATRTADLGGKIGTREFAEAVAAKLG